MEGVLDVYFYSRRQFVETALHPLISQMETTLHVKEYVLAVFLDLGGAFYNVFLGAFSSLYLRQDLVRFIDFLLKSSIVISSVGTTYPQRIVCKDTPQDDVLPSFLWRLVVIPLVITPQLTVTILPKLRRECVHRPYLTN